MCLAIPMKILSIDGANARCESRGVVREVSLFLLEPGSVAIGDHVMVHVGYAIQKVAAEVAEQARNLDAAMRPLDGGADA